MYANRDKRTKHCSNRCQNRVLDFPVCMWAKPMGENVQCFVFSKSKEITSASNKNQLNPAQSFKITSNYRCAMWKCKWNFWSSNKTNTSQVAHWMHHLMETKKNRMQWNKNHEQNTIALIKIKEIAIHTYQSYWDANNYMSCFWDWAIYFECRCLSIEIVFTVFGNILKLPICFLNSAGSYLSLAYQQQEKSQILLCSIFEVKCVQFKLETEDNCSHSFKIVENNRPLALIRCWKKVSNTNRRFMSHQWKCM